MVDRGVILGSVETDTVVSLHDTSAGEGSDGNAQVGLGMLAESAISAVSLVARYYVVPWR